MSEPTGGGTSLAVINPEKALERVEGVATSMAAKAKAGVEARYVVAMRNPRSWMTVREKLLEACKRPGFAAAALWNKKIGGKVIEGPSIRFAEEAARCAGNLLVETTVIHDGEDRQVMCVTVTDLEANLCYPLEMSLEKTVERKFIKDRAEGSVISVRTNTSNEKTYTVRATEDEMAVKRAAWASKLMRVGILRILPGDIMEEALATVKHAIAGEYKNDPKVAIKKVADLFFKQGVQVAQIEEYLGHPIERMTELELTDLSGIYNAIKDRENTWDEVMEMRAEARGAKPTTVVADAAVVTGATGGTRTSRLKEELERQKKESEAAAAAGQREPGEEG